MTPTKLLDDLKEKYSEWLEMAGEEAPAMMNEILSTLLIREMDKNEYYEKRLRTYEREKVTI